MSSSVCVAVRVRPFNERWALHNGIFQVELILFIYFLLWNVEISLEIAIFVPEYVLLDPSFWGGGSL